MARRTEAQLRNEIRRRVAEMIRLEGANLDPNKLDAIDVKAIVTEIESRYSIEIWDKVSPINGVDAAFVIERHGVQPDDVVYLIKRDGQVLFFQPFEPNVNGRRKMNANTVNTIARNHLDELLDDVVMDAIFPLLNV